MVRSPSGSLEVRSPPSKRPRIAQSAQQSPVTQEIFSDSEEQAMEQQGLETQEMSEEEAALDAMQQ
jgi:hypothetical protein